MELSVTWFMVQALAAAGALLWGCHVGRGSAARRWSWLGVGFVVLACWAFLKHNPVVAINAIPLEVLFYVEGTGAVPAFMMVVGIAYTRGRLPRQRRVAALAMAVGVIYFLQGGMWMVQTAPKQSFADSADSDVVLQSQEYSCVPAASATALHLLGITASEAEMAVLTRTHPGTGATLIRALDALRTKLAGHALRPNMYAPTYRQLRNLPMPALTPLQFEASRQHMVVIKTIDDRGVWIADPEAGLIHMSPDEFQAVYTRQVIVFER